MCVCVCFLCVRYDNTPLRRTPPAVPTVSTEQHLQLHSAVEETTPFLSLEILGDGDSLLQGQVASWTLRVTNLGLAPCRDALLKTNLPWLRLTGTAASASSFSGAPPPGAVGTGGTLLRLPLPPGGLAPGATADVPVAVRPTGGPGPRTLRLLLRYAGAAGARHRHVTAWRTVSVRGSLRVAASWAPGDVGAGGDARLLRVDAADVGGGGAAPVRLEELLLVSGRWRAVGLYGGGSGGGAAVGRRETFTAYVEVVQATAAEVGAADGGLVCSVCDLTNNGVSREDDAAALRDRTAFLCLETAARKFDVRPHLRPLLSSQLPLPHLPVDRRLLSPAQTCPFDAHTPTQNTVAAHEAQNTQDPNTGEEAAPRSIAQIRRASTAVSGAATSATAHPASPAALRADDAISCLATPPPPASLSMRVSRWSPAAPCDAMRPRTAAFIAPAGSCDRGRSRTPLAVDGAVRQPP